MSSDFVLYSPEIETIDPNLDELMEQIIDFWEKTVRESPTREGSGHAVRGAHAKTLGVVKAEVEMLGDVPAAYAQGIYAKPGRHDSDRPSHPPKRASGTRAATLAASQPSIGLVAAWVLNLASFCQPPFLHCSFDVGRGGGCRSSSLRGPPVGRHLA